jgi:ribosomal protein L19E
MNLWQLFCCFKEPFVKFHAHEEREKAKQLLSAIESFTARFAYENLNSSLLQTIRPIYSEAKACKAEQKSKIKTFDSTYAMRNGNKIEIEKALFNYFQCLNRENM